MCISFFKDSKQEYDYPLMAKFLTSPRPKHTHTHDGLPLDQILIIIYMYMYNHSKPHKHLNLMSQYVQQYENNHHQCDKGSSWQKGSSIQPWWQKDPIYTLLSRWGHKTFGLLHALIFYDLDIPVSPLILLNHTVRSINIYNSNQYMYTCVHE